MAKEFKITSLRLADLEKELNYLKTTREREIAAMIAEARSYGDLSENSEYDAAKNEQAKLYGRIAEIEDILSHAVIIEDENEASGRVGLGCTVTDRDDRNARAVASQRASRRSRGDQLDIIIRGSCAHMQVSRQREIDPKALEQCQILSAHFGREVFVGHLLVGLIDEDRVVRHDYRGAATRQTAQLFAQPAVLLRLGVGLGFLLAMVLFAGVRSRIEKCPSPECFKGLPITLIAASIVSMAFFGFGGVVDNLFK